LPPPTAPYSGSASSRCAKPIGNSVQYLVVGGQTPDGRDATNELSFLCLEAIDVLRIKEPNLTVRHHPGIDRTFWQGVCDAVRRGAGIGVYNDEAVIGSLVNLGVSPGDARGYVHYGCCNPHLPGWEPQLREYQHSLVKCLELALNNGRDPYPVKPAHPESELRDRSPEFPADEAREGPPTGEPEDLGTFADVMRAVKTQIAHDVARGVAFKRKFYAEDYLAHRPFCFEPALVHECVARGKDLNHGGARYVHHNNYAGGLGTAPLAGQIAIPSDARRRPDSDIAPDALLWVEWEQESERSVRDLFPPRRPALADQRRRHTDAPCRPAGAREIPGAGHSGDRIQCVLCHP
jgi:hypothetical protein